MQLEGIKKSLPYILIISILLADIIIYTGLTRLFIKFDETLTAGVLGLIGAVLGGSLTLIGVKWTLDSQIQRENESKKEEYKSYLSASNVIFNFDKEKIIGRKEKNRVILTESYQYLHGMMRDISYYSIIRYGGSEVVTNCNFKITVGSDKSFERFDIIDVWVDYFEKDEELLIPLCSRKLKEDQPWIKEIQATFYTARNDKIEFIQSEIENTRKQIFYDGSSKQIINFNNEFTAWTQKSN